MAHIRIENEYWRTPEFIKFTAGNEYRVLMFLIAHIVRVAEEDIHPAGAVRMRKNYFDKGKLCASYSMENIARIFGWGSEEKPNKSHVSRIIKRLEDMGLLEKIVENTPKGRKYVYQLGYYEGLYDTDSYEEHLYFDEYFGKKAKQHKQRKADAKEMEKEEDIVRRAKEKTRWFERRGESEKPGAKLNKNGIPVFDLTPEDEKAANDYVIEHQYGGKLPPFLIAMREEDN